MLLCVLLEDGTDSFDRIRMVAMVEEWRPVVGYETLYQVSSMGRIWGNVRNRVLKPIPNHLGYLAVGLHRGNTRQYRFIHVIVLAAFVGPKPEGQETRHLDADRTNNALSNLCYGTKSENAQDRIRHGHHENLSKTHCPSGHPYSGVNLYEYKGKRSCRICRERACRTYRMRAKQNQI